MCLVKNGLCLLRFHIFNYKGNVYICVCVCINIHIYPTQWLAYSKHSISVEWLNVQIKKKCLDVCAAAESLQSCPTLCDPIDGSPPGCPVPGILQARTLEWVALSSSNAWKWKVKVKSLSCVRLLATPWTAAFQAPPSMGFSRQEYWSGVPLPSPNIFLIIHLNDSMNYISNST